GGAHLSTPQSRRDRRERPPAGAGPERRTPPPTPARCPIRQRSFPFIGVFLPYVFQDGFSNILLNHWLRSADPLGTIKATELASSDRTSTTLTIQNKHVPNRRRR